jgi:hypothetical protein
MQIAGMPPTAPSYGDFVAKHVADAGCDRWRVRRGETWTYATPDAPERDQGWKIHLSATVANAEEVLRRAVPC